MFKLFTRQGNTKDEFYAICAGESFPLEEVADPVFSTKMMGDGIAVKPSDDTIYSPCEGEIILFPDTKHAIGIRTQRGTEILVHIGLDTVNFHGQGFQKLFPDQRVQTVQPLIRLDRGILNKADLTSMLIITRPRSPRIAYTAYGSVRPGNLWLQLED